MVEGREKDYRNANEEIHLDEAVKERMRQQLAVGHAAGLEGSRSSDMPNGRGSNRWRIPRGVVAACVAMVLVVVLFVAGVFDGVLGPWGLGSSMTALAAAEYPKIKLANYAEQGNFREEYGMYSDELLTAIKQFTYDSAVLVLGEETEKNLCYSPVSLYTALAVAAETAGGETRDEILRALHYVYPEGVQSGTGVTWMEETKFPIDSLAQDMYRYLYLTYDKRDTHISQISNSLWLNEDILPKERIRQDTAETLAKQYMASTYACNFTEEDVAQAMSDWVVKETKGLLGGQAEEFAVGEDTAMVLLSTVYYYDQWYDEFDKSRNVTDLFYKADGTTVEAEYMRTTKNPHAVLARDGYTAASLPMKGGTHITFVLPDEGVTPAQLLVDETVMDELLAISKNPEMDYLEVRFTVPKYQFQSEIDLTDTVKALGITKAFSVGEADFSGILEGAEAGSGQLFLAGIRQQTSMSIDEKGCEAAAFTQLDYATGAMPEDGIVELTLNRPFLIIIENSGPLFIGVINQP